MAHDSPDIDRIEAARRLYIKYEGKQHAQIEREMRSLGYTNFHRRILNSRFERGHHRPGWIEKYFLSEPPAVATEEGENGSGGVGELGSEGAKEYFTSSSLDISPQLPTPPLLHSPTATDFDHFQAWLKDVSPEMTWDWKHQVYIYKRLKRVSDGICKRLMIFLPPRHGKSELVTVRYTAWRMKQDPKMNVILGSYNQRLANRFSRKIKKVLMDDYALGSGGVEESGSGGVGQIRSGGERSSNENGSRSFTPPLPNSSTPPLANGPMFPFIRNRPKNTESEWETAVGGGLRAVGVGSGVTGFGANLIVIDDPVKSRAEAESAKMREKVWHWFNDDIYTRLEPNGSIVLIQTRWHEDDLAGRLLREPIPEGGEKWEVVNLPALAEQKSLATESTEDTEKKMNDTNVETNSITRNSKTASMTSVVSENNSSSTATTIERFENPATESMENTELSQIPQNSESTSVSSVLSVANSSSIVDDLGRKVGQALCPERYNELYFKNLREKIGSYSFASLYQQRPVPAEGGMFKRKWFENNIISVAPPNLRWKRGTDPGVSAGEKADYSASVRVAIDKDGNMYIADMFRRQVEYPELRRFMAERLKQERDVEHGIELAGHGPAIHQDLIKNGEAQGRAFRGIKITDPKMARALPWLALAEAGKVFLIRGPWNDEFLNETASFPMGTHDDQIDAVSIAFDLATAKSKKSWGF